MFFWFFESRNDPKNSPLTIWLSGGPGFSSMFALFQEARPCKVIANTTKTIKPPNSWNEVSNLLFIDEPIGAGFSYGSRLVNTTEQCASDIYEFLQKFFTKFPKYATLDLYLFSESYGGHYVPIMAKLIVQNNNLIKTEKMKDKIPINLKSCGIGGPWVNPLITMKSYVNYIENNTYNKSLISPQLIEEMRNKWIPCQQNIIECYRTNTTHDCTIANSTCWDVYVQIFNQSSGVDEYDIRAPNGMGTPFADYANFLDDPSVRRSIGVKTNEIKTNYVENNVDIYNRFAASGDIMHSTVSQVEFLLDNDIPILFFVGDADFICNWIGSNEMIESLKWRCQQEFNNAKFQDWKVDGLKVGEIRKVKNLWYAKFFRSSHFVPHDQPRNAFVLFKMWTENLN
ncbi:prepro-carboxypeptidase Z [Gigaspora margarita]|nr:prepro-carboxypeptidase Z [Gigaspora margarita]